MEELQVGEFIRTKSGELYKIDYVGESVVTAGEEVIIPLNYIENNSTDIIELVKVGDYVNGKMISNVDKIDNKNFLEWEDGDMYSTDIQNDKFIKSIVTKEKFSSVEFNVEA